MKRYVLTINKKKYWYVQDHIYLNKGAKKLTSMSLGRVDSATEQSLLVREQQVRTAFIVRESVERANYWQDRVEEKKVFIPAELKKIERERSCLYRAKKDLGPYGNSALETAFLVDFIYNSNKIEGSRLPKEEVKRLVQEEGGKNNEVTNTVAAMKYLQTDFDFSMKKLVKMHAFLLAHEPAKHGLRSRDILVGNDRTLCPPEQIKEKLAQLFSWYEQKRYILYPPEMAFLFYYRFERIHPFLDGNGRMGRLLMNEVLKQARYHPIIIWDKRRVAHFSAFERGREGELAPFLRFMLDQYFKTYQTYLKKIGPAIDYEKRVEYFMTPSED